MTVYRKKFDESKRYTYYANTAGQFYSINKKTGKRYFLKPYKFGNFVIVKANYKTYYCKNLIARLFIEGTKEHDVVEVINGEPNDFRVENLRVIPSEVFTKKISTNYQKQRKKMREVA